MSAESSKPSDHTLSDAETLPLSEYQQHVGRLLANPAEAIKRLSNPEIWQALWLFAMMMKDVGEFADAIKKFLFYNKPGSREAVLQWKRRIESTNGPLDMPVEVCENDDTPAFFMNAIHGILGTQSELPEVFDEIISLMPHMADFNDCTQFLVYEGHESDQNETADKLLKLKKEIGDLIFYPNAIATAFGFTMGDVGHTNINKLWVRFKDGFSEKAAIQRADGESEFYEEQYTRPAHAAQNQVDRQILEDMLSSGTVQRPLVSREEIFDIVETERLYQDHKWGNLQDRTREVGTYILLMQHHLDKAKQNFCDSNHSRTSLDELRKVLALGVACAEEHGLPSRTENDPNRPRPVQAVPVYVG